MGLIKETFIYHYLIATNMLEQLMRMDSGKIKGMVAEEFPELQFTNIDCRGIYITIDDFKHILKSVLERGILTDSFEVLREVGVPRTRIDYYIDMPYETHRGRYRFDVRNRSSPKFGAGDFSAHIYKDSDETQVASEQVAISDIGLKAH